MALTLQKPGVPGERPVFFALLPFIAAVILLLSGCAAPGAPVTRGTTKPQKITDLSAQQLGSSIVLSFTLPTETTKSGALTGTPEIQLYRAFAKTQGNQRRRGPKLKRIATIGVQTVRQNTQAGRTRLADSLTPKELAEHAGKDEVFYAVRARVERSSSGTSNVVAVPILPAPQPVNDLRAISSNNAIELNWSPPTILPQVSLQPTSVQYHIYRADAQNTTAVSVSENAAPSAEFALLGESQEATYRDASAKLAQMYRYMVRAIAEYPAGPVQSANSNVIEASLKTTPRPVAPANVIATFVSGNATGGPFIALSWAISTEPDLTGYNVYRSTAREGAGTRVNSAPILTPVFQDDSISPGETYFYRVAALNSSGSESDYSAAVEVVVPDSK